MRHDFLSRLFACGPLFSQVPPADFVEMGRHLGQLQRELHSMRKREEDRDRKTDLSLEAIEALIGAREEDSDRRFQEQSRENADRITKVKRTVGLWRYKQIFAGPRYGSRFALLTPK